jgi:hypothetical protein
MMIMRVALDWGHVESSYLYQIVKESHSKPTTLPFLHATPMLTVVVVDFEV